MKELRHAAGTILLEDHIAETLTRLSAELSENSMSAIIRLMPQGETTAIEFSLGEAPVPPKEHTLRAKPATGEGSHFPLEEI